MAKKAAWCYRSKSISKGASTLAFNPLWGEMQDPVSGVDLLVGSGFYSFWAP